MNMQHTLQHLFNKSSLEEVPLPALKEMVRKHPYFATGHLLLVKKLQQQGDASWMEQLQKTALYFHDPVWMDHLLKDAMIDSPAPVKEEPALQEVTALKPADNTAAEDVLLFEPYHTIDYFASQGIKLSHDPRPDDRLGNQLKSFTGWLKTLRRLPEAVAEETIDQESSERHTFIEKIAAHSLEEKEVVTEAMAEVLLLQGKKEKALAVYEKLSLLDPTKRAYFAARIKELNTSQL